MDRGPNSLKNWFEASASFRTSRKPSEEQAKALLLLITSSHQSDFARTSYLFGTASLAGLSIDALETIVTGSWDRRGLFKIENVSPFFNPINVETRVSTKDPPECILQVARETHRRCPVHATLARATELVFKLVVNGQALPI